ncbi:MAG: family 78 glycoside hydrolase catalytic domain [Caldilineaceae bacterium]
MTNTTISSLQIEHLQATLGIGTPAPRLSWQVETSAQNWQQRAYELRCLDSDGKVHQTTGKVDSDQSALVAWPFAPLQSRERVSVEVRVWGSDDSATDWSAPLAIEAGLLTSDDWSAQFITPALTEDKTIANPAPYLRHSFDLGNGIRAARLYISALGVYEAQLNGQTVGDHVLAPGWTVYNSRLRYQTFDVTDLVEEGPNVLGAIVGEGWYRGRLGFGGGRRNIYGEKAALIAQLEVEYEDGFTERIVTDDSWRATTGPIVASSIYDGETYDARLELGDWSEADYDDDNWSSVRIHEQSLTVLEAPLGPPVRRIERIAPVAITQSPTGKTLVDFGQNLVGRLSIRVQGEAGQTVTLRHAEVLEDGELGTRPLRHAEATDRFILRGGAVEIYEPYFTFHGFRYVEVEGWPGELTPDAIAAVVIHSDMARTGWFECSDPMLNQLHQNVLWGMRGNFLDVPTDCPQRDERMGWTGDIQVFAPTSAFLYDVHGFLQSWLRDLAVEQAKFNGSVPFVVPDIMGGNGAAAWGDAAVVVPWVLYQRYGDLAILATQFASMCEWVDHIAGIAGESFLWDTGFQFGDWLDPTAPPDNPFMARTDGVIVASAYFAYSASLVAQSAALLGEEAARQKYAAIAAKAKAAFANEYITPAGRMMNDAETAYALAIIFDLLATPAQRQRAGDRLAELVRGSGYQIRTGFVGTPLLCDALCATGHHDKAYRLLKQEECPSWLYPVTMGATTIWERWDSMLSDGSINPGEMTSFNHYALGAVADWMQRTIGGIDAAEPGYRTIRFAPRPGGKLSHCETRLQTPYGLAECRWHIADGAFEMSVTAPPNARGIVMLPGQAGQTIEVGAGQWQWSAPYVDPDARGPYTVDDPIGDILSEKNGRATIIAALDRLNAPHFLRGLLFRDGNASLRQAMMRMPEEAVAVMNEALATLGG